ncbi:hypothetical protein HDV02_002601 [Globomyces sp. JEL0801]|nr:hypothetical protein HDV02_002601 [Globomyces sp. JEL0801]
MSANQLIGGIPTVNYFDLGSKGRGEVVRLFFAEAGVEFKDHRIQFADWPALKEKYISEGFNIVGSLPVVELNNQRLTQSIPTLRYLSKKLGKYNGSNDEEAYLVDQVADILIDWRASWASSNFGKTEAHINQVLPKILRSVNDFLTRRNGPYILGSELSYADIFIYQFLNDDGLLGSATLDSYAGIKKFITNFEARPNVSKYLKSRSA